MRADRLVATLLLMQARGRVTAAQVAAELGVSLATARRDLEALSLAGVPVYPQPGRGGGWSLVGGARTDLTGLTAAEATALLALVGTGSSAGSAGSSPAVASALRKLVQALPETFRAGAEAAAGAVVADPAGWGERDRSRPAVADLLQDAVVRRRRVSLDYRDRAGRVTQRLVDPWGLVDKGGAWYLLAGTDGGRRTFRLDRLAAVAVTGQPASRPADLSLAQEWDRVVEDVEQRRSTVAATVLVPPRSLPVLLAQFGRHAEPLGTEPDGRVRVRVRAHLVRSVAETLAGWGAAVEVLEPPEVRAELAVLGAELVAAYGETPA